MKQTCHAPTPGLLLAGVKLKGSGAEKYFASKWFDSLRVRGSQVHP